MVEEGQGPEFDRSIDADTICTGSLYSFSIGGSDPDGDNVRMYLNSPIPGASFSVSNNNSPNPVGSFSWRPGIRDVGPHTFDIVIESPGCQGRTERVTQTVNIFVESCCKYPVDQFYIFTNCPPDRGEIVYCTNNTLLPRMAQGSEEGLEESAGLCLICTRGWWIPSVFNQNRVDITSDPCYIVQWYDEQGNLLHTGSGFVGSINTMYKAVVTDVCNNCSWEAEFKFKCCEYQEFHMSMMPGSKPCNNPNGAFLLGAFGTSSGNNNGAAPGQVSYLWTSDDPMFGTRQSPQIGAKVNTTYYLKVTDAAGCVFRDTFRHSCCGPGQSMYSGWEIQKYPWIDPCTNPSSTYYGGIFGTPNVSNPSQQVTINWTASDPKVMPVRTAGNYFWGYPDVTYYAEVIDANGCVYRDTFHYTCCAVPTNLQCSLVQINGKWHTRLSWDPVLGANTYDIVVNTNDPKCCGSLLPKKVMYTNQTSATSVTLPSKLSAYGCLSWNVTTNCKWSRSSVTSPTVCVSNSCVRTITRYDDGDVVIGGIGGRQGLESEPQLSVFPSPASSRITVKGDAVRQGNAIKMVDIAGRVVLQSVVEQDMHHHVDVQALPNGIYFLQTTDTAGELITHKVVVRR